MNEKANIFANGQIEVFIRKDGKDEVVQSTHNALQATSVSVIADALAGGGGITNVYFLYTNKTTPTQIGASGGDLTAEDLWNTAYGSSVNGVIIVPVFSMGLSDSTGGTTVDTATFAAITDSTSSTTGLSWADGHKVYALGLVHRNKDGVDVLYAAVDITPIQKAANAQVGVRWKTTIAID